MPHMHPVEPVGSRKISKRTASIVLTPLLVVLLVILLIDTRDRHRASSGAAPPSSSARVPSESLVVSTAPQNSNIDTYFSNLIETSPKDDMTMRLKATPTEREVEQQVGQPADLRVEKPGETPRAYLTEFNPVTFGTWKGQGLTAICEFSHKDGKLFDLSIQRKAGVSYAGVGRNWRQFHF